MFEWINFVILILSLFLFCYLYTLSIQPVKREKHKGKQAWNHCMRLRLIAGLFEFFIVINLILWIWYPVPLINWQISPNYMIGIIIGILITIPCLIIMLKGMKDAGKESLKPSQETEMYGGIYNYIRHPQTLGEFPLFIAIAFMVNSWFLVILMSLFVFIYVPIMIHYEEQDLIRRFGEKYREYQKRTGALFPKFKK
ncbi:MAG: methyltransferase family protein [Candidatus Hermodarchaeota archaeon]